MKLQRLTIELSHDQYYKDTINLRSYIYYANKEFKLNHKLYITDIDSIFDSAWKEIGVTIKNQICKELEENRRDTIDLNTLLYGAIARGLQNDIK